MKDSTIVRLRMSKKLFESLADQILAEAKDMSGGAYTEAVKVSSGEKKDKAPKGEKKVNTEVSEKPKIPELPSSVNKLNVKSVNASDVTDVKSFARAIYDFAKKIEKGEGFNPESNPNVKKAMDALRVAAGIPAIPDVPASASKKLAIPPVPGGVKEMETRVAEYYDSREYKDKATIDKEFADRMKNDKEYQKLSKDIKDKASSLHYQTKPMDRRGMVGEKMDESNLNEYIGLSPEEVKALEWLAAAMGTGTGAAIASHYGKEIKDLAQKAIKLIKSKRSDKSDSAVAEAKKEEE